MRMSELATLLRELEETWRRKGFDQGSRFAPGLQPDEVVSQLASEGLPAPAEIVDWFSWRNGARGFPNRLSELVELVPCGLEPGNLGACLGPELGRRYYLEHAQGLASVHRGSGDPEQTADPDFWWDPNWLPLMFANTDTIAVDLSSGSDMVSVLSISYWTGDFRSPVADSLADFVRTLLALPDESWHFSDHENRWRVDLAALSRSNSIPPRFSGLLTSGGLLPAA
jgi:hypothetical protein